METIHRRIPDTALCSNKATSMNVPVLLNPSPISFPFYDPSLLVRTTGAQQSSSVPVFFLLLTNCKLIFSWAWSCPPGKPETYQQLLTHFRMGFSENKINVSAILQYYVASSRGAKSIASIVHVAPLEGLLSLLKGNSLTKLNNNKDQVQYIANSFTVLQKIIGCFWL